MMTSHLACARALGLVIAVATAAGCRPKEVVLIPTDGSYDTGDPGWGNPDEVDDTGDTGEADTGDTGEWIDPAWDEASLVVLTPESGDFIPLGEDADFIAEIRAADGSLMDFDEVEWTSDIDGDWALLGLEEEDDSLTVGTHAITARAALPNGDRLTYTVGGVLVQHENAGTYAGDVMVDVTIEYDGTPYTVSCIGSTLIVVEPEGETADGTSDCTISLLGYDTVLSQVFAFDLDDEDVSGEASLDFDWFAYDFSADGIVGDGELSAEWGDDVFGFATVEGTLEATRISRETTSD